MKEIPQQEFFKGSIEELKKAYPNLDNDDFNHLFNEKKVLSFDKEFIGYRKYSSLKNKQSEFNNFNILNPDKTNKKLSDLEIKQLENYESKHSVQEIDLVKTADYFDKIYSKKQIEFTEGILPIKKNIYKNFLTSYKYLNGNDFILTEESIKNIEPIIKYFSFDKTFFDTDNSIKSIGNKQLEPSFNKGLLIIGNVGNGKTSVMKAMQFMIDFYLKKSLSERWDTSGDWNRIKFSFKTCESLVSEYEFLKNAEEKETFFNKYSSGNLFLDDLKREKDASNFGITNVVKSILEKRYNNQKKYSDEKVNHVRTFATMNFHDNYPNNIDFAIQECGIRYGAHVYDRVFEMFNIIEFKGKSLRK